MFPALETERLHLKCIGQEDAEFFYKEFSTDEVNRYLYDAEPCADLGEAREWIGFYTEGEPSDRHRWILVRKADGERIGTCGFHCLDAETGETEIGYDLQPAYRRQGYMTEALGAVLAYLKSALSVRRVFAHIFADNLASQRTVAKLGFVKTEERYYEEFRGEKYPHDVWRLELR